MKQTESVPPNGKDGTLSFTSPAESERKRRKKKRRTRTKNNRRNDKKTRPSNKKEKAKRLKNLIPDESLMGSVAENILGLLCTDKKAARRICKIIRPEHFENSVYRDIAGQAIEYLRKYKKAAGDHLPDLFEEQLNSTKKSKVRMYSEALHAIHDISDGINRKFVFGQLQDFVCRHVMRQTITFAAEKLQSGDLVGAQQELERGLRTAGTPQHGVLDAIRQWRQFRALEFPPVEDALGPAFQWPGITQIAGFRGDGKTWLVLYVCVALACGVGVFGWTCKRAYRVLFVDGELPPWALQERLEAVIADLGVEPAPGMLNIFSVYEGDAGTFINLADPKQTDELVERMSHFEVVCLDNLSALSSGVDPNSAEAHEPVNALSMRLRGLGTLVIRVTHLGKDKSRGARGSSRQEDPLDVALQLERQSPETFHNNDVIRITCNKSRNHPLSKFKPVDLEFSQNNKGRFVVEHRTAFNSKTGALVPDIVELMKSGEWKKVKKGVFADTHGVDRTTVYRAAKTAKARIMQENLSSD